ncbi:MAG TPA: Gx transporter family protein, partial [Spirochaetia bacterium]|nr:Gx transporter family protein [Spirochaetia bacterium]
LPLLSVPYTLLLILLKVIGQAFIQGSLFSYVFIFSLSSSLSSAIVMLLIHRIFTKGFSLVGISVMGALASNVCQVFLAVYLVFGTNGWLIAPFLLAVGLVSSVLLGLFAQNFVQSSLWFRRVVRGT